MRWRHLSPGEEMTMTLAKWMDDSGDDQYSDREFDDHSSIQKFATAFLRVTMEKSVRSSP